MTDRYSAFTVVLTADLRDDDAEPLMKAIAMLSGVLTVTPHVSDFVLEAVTEARVKSRLRKAMDEALR